MRVARTTLVALLFLAACDNGSETAVSTTTTSIEDIAAQLWESRKEGIAGVDRATLESVESGIALTMDRTYYIDYLPYAAGQAIRDPLPDGHPVVLARTPDSFVAYVEEGFQMPHGPVSDRIVYRADKLNGSWKISYVTQGRDASAVKPSGPLRSLSADGLDLLAAYVRFRRHVEHHLAVPEEPKFAPGQFTTRMVASIKTHKEPEPWEVTTGRLTVDKALTRRHGFTVEVREGELHCGVLVERLSISHRDGVAIEPSPVLGDRAFLVPNGRYEGFTWVEHFASCVLNPSDEGAPEIPFSWSFSTSVTGKPARTA